MRTEDNRPTLTHQNSLQICIRTAVHRRRRGGLPPPGPPPLLPFQCLRLTAKSLLRHLRCQEDLRFKILRPAFGGDHRGALGGGCVPAKPLPPPPFRAPLPPPSNTSLPPPPPLLGQATSSMYS